MLCRSPRVGGEGTQRDEDAAEEERDRLFPTQTIHRWGSGTGCRLFGLESPMRLLCSRGVRRALGDRRRGVCQWREEQQGKATREYSRVGGDGLGRKNRE